jgi:acetyl-CoA synthetase
LSDYFAAYAAFDLPTAYSVLADGGRAPLNAAVECCDRWCGAGRVALRWSSEACPHGTLGFDELRDESSRMANLLVSLGVGPGDKVAGLLPRTPELLITILATWRIGAVYQPLFTAFGPKAIEHRLQTSRAKVVVTDPGNRSKLHGLTYAPAIAVTHANANGLTSDVVLRDSLPRESGFFEPILRGLDDPFLMMFTSGTTGPAKPLLVPLKAIAAFVGYMRDALDLRPTDNFWNMADPGWAYGLYYAVTGPLAMGHTTHFFDHAFSVSGAVRMMETFAINNLAGAPTAFRQFVAAGPERLQPLAGKLRAVSSAGEALNPDVVRWFATHLDTRIMDHYGQTELGMVVCNHHALDHPLRPGSAGFPVPGHRVVVLDEHGGELPPRVPGDLCVDRSASPLFWFNGYEGQGGATDRYYRSGDTVELNEDGSISFVGRADDVITSSGYRIGPFDVESALVEHPAVVEAAVIGKPDPQRTEIVKAFVVLRAGHSADDAMARVLQDYVRSRLSAHAYPREVEFVDELPKTPSGKIQRFLLRAQEKQRAAPGASAP